MSHEAERGERPTCVRCHHPRDLVNGGDLIYGVMPAPPDQPQIEVWACWECRAERAFSWDLPTPECPRNIELQQTIHNLNSNHLSSMNRLNERDLFEADLIDACRKHVADDIEAQLSSDDYTHEERAALGIAVRIARGMT